MGGTAELVPPSALVVRRLPYLSLTCPPKRRMSVTTYPRQADELGTRPRERGRTWMPPSCPSITGIAFQNDIRIRIGEAEFAHPNERVVPNRTILTDQITVRMVRFGQFSAFCEAECVYVPRSDSRIEA